MHVTRAGEFMGKCFANERSEWLSHSFARKFLFLFFSLVLSLESPYREQHNSQFSNMKVALTLYLRFI
jgi:hypothetical protein